MKNDIHHILVVDDETVLANTLKRHLSMEGFDVDTAYDGAAACEKIVSAALSKKQYHLVITDICMPKQDGISLIDMIKSQYPDISILVITGFGISDLILGNIRSTIDYCCPKPITPDTLLGIFKIINKRRQQHLK
ncbi:MAG: response regulator [Desulfobacterales bacterium]|nr:response regulator [Desulfobacterales bacterium]